MDSTNLANNNIYKTILPNFVMVLSAIYICMYLIRTLQIIYRKRQRKREEIEKHRLRYYWSRATLQDELNTDQEKGIVYPPSAHPSSSSTIVKDNSLKFHNGKQKEDFWSKRQSKRLNLLWQWSVSVGYCENPHAKELNELIHILTSQETN